MKMIPMALALAAALATATTASAASVSAMMNANACFSVTPGVSLVYTQWGPYNPSTNTWVTVNCPMTLPSQNYTSVYLQVSAWNRNSGATRLSCTIAATGWDGNSKTSATATIPYNTAGAGTSTATNYPSWQNVWPYLTCAIPPNNGNGYSYLSTLYVSGTW